SAGDRYTQVGTDPVQRCRAGTGQQLQRSEGALQQGAVELGQPWIELLGPTGEERVEQVGDHPAVLPCRQVGTGQQPVSGLVPAQVHQQLQVQGGIITQRAQPTCPGESVEQA